MNRTPCLTSHTGSVIANGHLRQDIVFSRFIYVLCITGHLVDVISLSLIIAKGDMMPLFFMGIGADAFNKSWWKEFFQSCSCQETTSLPLRTAVGTIVHTY